MLTAYYREEGGGFKTLYKHLPKVCAVSVSSTSVKTVEEKVQRKIEVSFDPMDVNQGITYDTLHENMIIRSRITSEEDYGYIVDIGVLGVVAFLKINKEDCDLVVGSVLDLQIVKLENDNKNVTLSLLDDDYKEMETELKGSSIHTLLPGNLVRFHVEEYCTNGIIIGFAGTYQGAIDVSNLLPNIEQSSWKKNWNAYRNKMKRLVGRIVCVDASSKILRLSLLDHVMCLDEKVPGELEVGCFVEDLEIVKVERGFGVLAVYPLDTAKDETSDKDDESDGMDDLSYTMEDINDDDFGDAFETKKESILSHHRKPPSHLSIYIHTKENYNVGDKLPKVRIVSKKWIMDKYTEGSIDPSVLSASIFSYSQLVPGKIYKCTIQKILINKTSNDVKLLISLGPNLNAMITSQHLFDKGLVSSYKLSSITKKFREGMEIHAQYLHVDDYNNYYFTMKPSLISQDTKFCEHDIKINDTSFGYITKKDERKGLFVMFYNHIHGIVPLYDCVNTLGQDWYNAHGVGDVIKCRVTSIQNRLVLSLNLSSQSSGDVIAIGTIIPKGVMKVYEVTHKEIKVVMRMEGDEIVGVIPFTQLCDVYEDIQGEVKDLYPVGTKIQSKGIVMRYNPLNGITISIRPSFTCHTKHYILPSSYSEITKHSYLLGSIHNKDERYGTFVRYLNGVSGYISKKMCDMNKLPLNHTLIAQVVSVDVENEKLAVKPCFEKTKEVLEAIEKDVDGVILVRVTAVDGDVHVETMEGSRGVIPLLEISKDIDILQNLKEYYTVGKIIQVRVISTRILDELDDEYQEDHKELLTLSILRIKEKAQLPKVGSVVIGRVNRSERNTVPTSILLDVRGCMVRCCISELMDEWVDEPIGKFGKRDHGLFPHGKLVQVRILSYPMHFRSNTPSTLILNGTLRTKDVDTSIPKIGDEVQGYVIQKTTKECIVLASSSSSKSKIIGRVIPDKPTYPVGRLVKGVVRDVCDLMNGDIGVQLDTSK